MKVYIFETTEEDKQGLTTMFGAPVFKDIEFVWVEEKLTDENAGNFSDANGVSVFINSVVNQSVIDKMPELKFICTRSTGYDHINSAYAVGKNIVVSNVPAYGSRTVAEFAFSLILGLTRKTFLAYRQVKDNHNYNISNFEGFNLQGKTLGIVGTGRIGQNVAQIAKGFDMKILGFDAFPNSELAQKLGFIYVSLNELLAQSDVITLHVPYNKDTHHLINSENVNQIKPGAILVNTSRGEVADSGALLSAVENKIISGLGMDVIEGEKMLIDESHYLETAQQEQLKMLFKDHLLIDRNEVVFTPHIAFFTIEAKREILQTSADNLAGFLQGAPKNQVKI